MRNPTRTGLIILILSIAFCNTVYGQAHKNRSEHKKEYVIPFHLTDYNNLSIEAVVNGKDTVHFMFHTAANSVSLIEEAVKRTTTLHFDSTYTTSSWGGDGNTSRRSSGNVLRIGDLTWHDLEIFENKYSGQQTDGKLGIDLFQEKVIEIDFDRNIIILRESLPKKTRRYEKLKLTREQEFMFVEAECVIGDASFKNRFLIHSGYAGAILFDDKFSGDNKLGEKLKIVG
ncbi:MAG TPA: aspartyl protease family protein, partial [Ohtaekwangia sp.]|uniref:aspartyl protease family protein n=1 Tax=Ohtaekwangia sp. TaxID=2066019 RepID=UPI002F924350